MKLKLLAAALLLLNVALAETIYRFPPIRYVTQEEIHQQYLNYGKQLMDVKGVPDADDELVCTNWVCPTSIVVNAVQYSIATDEWAGVIHLKVTGICTNVLPETMAIGEVFVSQNGKSARRLTFAEFNRSDIWLATDVAPYVDVRNLDPATNMMYVSNNYRYGGTNNQNVVYRNLIVTINAPTNAVDFAVAIINAGLPESERIVLP